MTRSMFFLLLLVASFSVHASAEESEAKKKFYVGADLVDVGEHQEAIRWLREALELDPNICQAHYYLSQAYLGLDTAEGISKAGLHAALFQGCASGDVIRDVEQLLANIQAKSQLMGFESDSFGPRVDQESGIDSAATASGYSASVSLQVQRRRQAGAGLLIGGGAAGIAGAIGAAATYGRGVDHSAEQEIYADTRQANHALGALGIIGAGIGAAGLVIVLLPGEKRGNLAVVPGPIPTVSLRF